MRGRPSSYTPELADRICSELSEGKSLRTVCAPDDMPSKVTIFNWLRTNPEFLNQYARAKAEAADALVDEILDIADDGTNDWMERKNQDGDNIGWQVNGEHIQRSRVRIDTRKWIASKLKPKKYGEKIMHSGDSEGEPIRVRGVIDLVKPNNSQVEVPGESSDSV